MPRRSLIELQNGQERLLGHFDRSDLLHALLSFFLFFEQFALARDIAAVALCRHVLADSLDGLASDDLGSDSRLHGDVELLAWYQFLQFLAHTAAECHGIVDVRECRQRIYAFAVEEYVEFDELALAEVVDMVVERRVTLRYAF